MTDKQLRWDLHFLDLAKAHAKMSKDPSTKVGAVIVGPDLEIRSAGFNGFPRGVEDSYLRLHDKALKYQLVVHAEMNAILAACRIGTPLKDCTLYLVAMEAEAQEKIWGGPPCSRCLVEIIQAGIRQIVSYPRKDAPSRWHDSLDLSESLMQEVGITYREIS